MFHPFDAEEHQKKNDKIVRDILRNLARRDGVPYRLVVDLFLDQDLTLTADFWSLLRARCGDSYDRVDYCHCCQAFHLFHTPKPA